MLPKIYYLSRTIYNVGIYTIALLCITLTSQLLAHTHTAINCDRAVNCAQSMLVAQAGIPIYNLDRPAMIASPATTETSSAYPINTSHNPEIPYNLDDRMLNRRNIRAKKLQQSHAQWLELDRQLIEAIWKLKENKENPTVYREIVGLLKAGADPLFQTNHDVIDAFHLFLALKSKNPAVYKETQEVFLEKMQ